MRIEPLASKHNIEIIWRPFLLGPIFKKQGWNDSPFNIYPVKGKYMWRDLERICGASKLPFVRPTLFPQNGLQAARIATKFSKEAWAASFIKSIYIANFQNNQDISSKEVISKCIEDVGENAANVMEEDNTQQSKNMLREQTDLAYQLNIFGAPSFYVDSELFWGDDRLESAVEWAAKK